MDVRDGKVNSIQGSSKQIITYCYFGTIELVDQNQFPQNNPNISLVNMKF